MPRWSLASGSPAFGDAPRSGAPSASAADAERHARRAAAMGGLALAAALGARDAPFVPPAWGWAALAGAIVLVPLLVGMRIGALHVAQRAGGRLARGPRLMVEALVRRGDDALGAPEWRRLPQGLAARWALGAFAPVALLAHLVPLRPADRVRAEASIPALSEALAAAGARVERDGSTLSIQLPPAHEGATPAPARLRPRRTLDGARALDARGPPEALRRLRRLLEGPAAHALLFTTSAPAQRWERRLNALAREALVASTLEERSLLLEETDRLRQALEARALAGEEWTILSLKEARLRALLSQRLLSEPPGMRLDGNALAPLPALAPDLARVLDAGGLGAMGRVVFVPFWILPVETPWGEQEVCVNGATGRYDAEESRALLAAMRERGPGLLVEAGAKPQFLPHAPPTGALLRELRAHGVRIPPEVATGATPADVVYVPYLAGPHGYASGVTGNAAPDLGAIVPEAQGPYAKA